MPRKHDEPVVSRHIEVFESDWAKLQRWFGRESEERLGTSHAIRQMIRKGIRDYEARLQAKLDRLPRSPGASQVLDIFFEEGAPRGK